MTKIKFCGLTREEEIAYVNEMLPDYIGFVFYKASRRYITPEKAAVLKKKLDARISVVGVFVDEIPETAAELIHNGTIDIAQLHGNESEEYITHLHSLTDKPIIKAFSINRAEDVISAQKCPADFVLLDSRTGGSGNVFDWSLLKGFARPFFLAGGLNRGNISRAIEELAPYALDVSSGIETDGIKDKHKMLEILCKVRERNEES